MTSKANLKSSRGVRRSVLISTLTCCLAMLFVGIAGDVLAKGGGGHRGGGGGRRGGGGHRGGGGYRGGHYGGGVWGGWHHGNVGNWSSGRRSPQRRSRM